MCIAIERFQSIAYLTSLKIKLYYARQLNSKIIMSEYSFIDDKRQVDSSRYTSCSIAVLFVSHFLFNYGSSFALNDFYYFTAPLFQYSPFYGLLNEGTLIQIRKRYLDMFPYRYRNFTLSKIKCYTDFKVAK